MTRTQATYALRPTGPALMPPCVENVLNVHALRADLVNVHASHAFMDDEHAHTASKGNVHAPYACLDNAQVSIATTADGSGCAPGDTPLAHAESGLRARRLRALGACPQGRTSKALSTSDLSAPIPTTRTSYSTLRHTSACHLAYGFDRVLSSRGSPLLLDCIGFGSKRGRKGGRCL